MTVPTPARGERGPHGDHGQDGRPGPRGVPGRNATAGDTGKTGARGRSFSRWQVLVAFLFIVVSFVSLAAFYERGQRQLERVDAQLQEAQETQEMDRYRGCLRGNEMIEQFNSSQIALAEIERTQTIDRDLAERRIAAYEAAVVLPLNDCEALLE